jgi:hypothetical protein
VEEEHGCDRPPDGGRAEEVRRAPQHEPRRQAADVQPRLSLARSVGLRDPGRRCGARRRPTPTARTSATPTTMRRTSSSCARPTARRASRSRAGCRRSCRTMYR